MKKINNKKFFIIRENKYDINIEEDEGIIRNTRGIFELNDFLLFRKKLCGILILKGKKSLSIKIYNYILNNLKKNIKDDPLVCLFFISLKLVSIITINKKKYGKRLLNIPVIIKAEKKYINILKWLIKSLKNISNIRGIKKEDIIKNLLDTYNSKGIAINLKKENYKQILKSKYNLIKNKSDKQLIKNLEWKKKKHLIQQKEKEMLIRIKGQLVSDEEIKRFRERKKKRKSKQFWNDFINKNDKFLNINYKKILVK